MTPTILLAAALAHSPAHAALPEAPEHQLATVMREDEPDEDTAKEGGKDGKTGSKEKKELKERQFQMEIGFRGRAMSLPQAIMSVWYHDSKDAGWPLADQGRPAINGWSVGLEFVVKKDSANGIFYFDYVDSNMPGGYWDDKERDEDPNFFDGEWIEPSKTLGLATFGANYGYELHLVKTEKTKGYFGLSMLFGGGVGLGILIGDIEVWEGASGKPAYQLYDEGDAANGETKVPRVYPMLDLNASLRLNFADRAVLRLEGGLHSMFYWGASLGVMF